MGLGEIAALNADDGFVRVHPGAVGCDGGGVGGCCAAGNALEGGEGLVWLSG